MKLRIDRVPIGPNSTTRNGQRIPGLLRWHWTKRRRYTLGWKNEVRAVAGFGTFAMVRRRVTITLHRRRLLDDDNAVASCKPLLDALKACGLIHDDSRRWILLQVDQVKDREEFTEIEINEVPA